MRLFFLCLVGLPRLLLAWQTFLPWSIAQQPSCSRLHATSDNDDENKDPVLRLPLMEAELAILGVHDETDDRRRLELEEAIQNAKTAAEFGVRRAQVQFYDAFSNGNLNAMSQVWSNVTHVRCIHPGMSSLEGRDAVMHSWAQMFSSPSSFDIEPSRARVDVCGQTAICSCIENTPNGGKLEALNVYRREGEEWKMTLHMASIIML